MKAGRWAAALLVGAALVPFAGLPSAAAVAAPVVVHRGPLARTGATARVVVVGDSLTVGSASTLDPLLAGYQLDLDAQVGRATPGAPAIVRRLGAASADVVVVALGTNDAGNGSRYESLARAVVAEASPTAHLVWVLPHRFTSEMDGVRRSVVSVLAHRPRSSTVDDDALWVAHPEVHAGDGVHLTADGYRRRAASIADGVAAALSATDGFAARPTGGSWTVNGKGAVAAQGGAPLFGDLAAVGLNRPVVGMAATPTGRGYWLVASDGGVFSFGDAAFFGSLGGVRLQAPVLTMAATPSGHGYWLLATDGGVFTFGDAAFHGSTGNMTLRSPAVALAASNDGYVIATTDGSVYPFGAVRSFGSLAGIPLNAPVVGVAMAPGGGYWLVATDGGVFCFGPGAAFHGSTGGFVPPPLVAGLAPRPDGGYTVVGANGTEYPFPA